MQQVQQSSNDRGSSQFPRVQHDPEWCTLENASNPHEQRVVAGVAPQEGVFEGEHTYEAPDDDDIEFIEP